MGYLHERLLPIIIITKATFGENVNKHNCFPGPKIVGVLRCTRFTGALRIIFWVSRDARRGILASFVNYVLCVSFRESTLKHLYSRPSEDSPYIDSY